LSKLYKSFQKYHKWTALIFTLFFILFSLSGILLNHRTLIKGVDVSRKWLPKSYDLHNWNLASVKGVVEVGEDSLLFYGGAGIWLTDKTFSEWESFMNGLPNGSDQRKIFDLVKSLDGNYFAATRFGLYQYSRAEGKWSKQQFFSDDEFITGLEVVKGTLYVLTRNHLYSASLGISSLSFSQVELIVPVGSKPTISIFRLFWIIHSGEILGIPGRLLVDIGGLIMLFLSVTGLIYFLFPMIIKRVKAKPRLNRLKRATRFSYKWHLNAGIFTAALLVVVSFTGMFLRPPFLLFVVNGGINQNSNSKTVNEVFWHDKLRDIRFDESRDIFLLAAADGIYYSRDSFTTSLQPFELVPPISVMGINVFEILPNGDYLVGSFSGAYRWNPYRGIVSDYITGQPAVQSKDISSPFGSLAVAGYANVSGKEYFFDYNRGVIKPLADSPTIEMTKMVQQSFPFPLWNLAQEVHTCRIYSPVISVFYILIVPLAGMAVLLITLTGVLMWSKRRSQKSGARGQGTNSSITR